MIFLYCLHFQCIIGGSIIDGLHPSHKTICELFCLDLHQFLPHNMVMLPGFSFFFQNFCAYLIVLFLLQLAGLFLPLPSRSRYV